MVSYNPYNSVLSSSPRLESQLLFYNLPAGRYHSFVQVPAEHPLGTWERVQSRVLIEWQTSAVLYQHWGVWLSPHVSLYWELWWIPFSSLQGWISAVCFRALTRKAFSLFCHCVKLHIWNDVVMIFQRAPSTELSIFFFSFKAAVLIVCLLFHGIWRRWWSHHRFLSIS